MPTNRTLGLVRLATSRRVTITMVTLAILIFGFVSVSRLKVNLLPELSYPTITIRTELPGAAPVEVENLISKPIEDAVGVIKGVRTVRSVSRSGQSDVTLEFAWGTQMDYAGVDIREKIDVLTLPLDAKRPILLRFDPSSEPVVRLGLSMEGATGALDADRLKALRRFSDDQLKKEFESLTGVAAVKVSGGLEDEVQILVDQDKLSQLQLPLETIVDRLRAENVNLSGGKLEEGSQQFLVRTINEFQSVGQIADAIVAVKDGKPVYLRDVATVRQGWKEREAITRFGGEESVELAIYKEGDANTVAVAKAVQDRIEKVSKNLPKGVVLKKVYDQSTFISNAVSEVTDAALIGGLLSAIIIFLFLRNAWATVIITIAIPVSVIAAFNVMYFNNITLNIMSLGGIALAVGMLVDDSIVVLENIEKRLRRGEAPVDAAINGTSEMGLAVVATTLTTVAVFFPLVFVRGIAGQLFRDQALTITYTLLFSLIVSLTLIPMLASLRRAKRNDGNGPTPAAMQDAATVEEAPNLFLLMVYGTLRAVRTFFAGLLTYVLTFFVAVWRMLDRGIGPVADTAASWFQRGYARVETIYARLIDAALDHPAKVLTTAILSLFVAAAIVPLIGVELIPQLSQGEFYVRVKLPPGSPLARTDEVIGEVQRAAAKIDSIATTYSVAGTGNRLDANPVDAGENTGTLNVVMKKSSDRSAEDSAIAELRSALGRIPGVEYEFGRPELFSFKTPLEVEVGGYDLDALKSAADRIALAMQSSDRFADVKSSMKLGNPEIQIRFDQERAAKLGLVVSQVADRVVNKVRGQVATRYSWRDRKIDVLVRNMEDQRASIEDIRKLVVNPESDRPITLDAIADVTVDLGPSEIRRVDQERVAVVTASTRYGDLGSAVAEVRGIIAHTPLQAGVTTRVTGQSEEMDVSFTSMKFAFALAVFLVYLVMASQFESLLHPFIILFTIPLGVVGAVLALFMTHTTISVVVFIGLIMLAGIVVKNAIILIDVINNLRASGVELRRAVVDGCEARLRPIVMTTMTTCLGLLPMALGIGDGAEIRAPMAITVIGGLTFSTLLTLVVIPVVYLQLERLRAPALGGAVVQDRG